MKVSWGANWPCIKKCRYLQLQQMTSEKLGLAYLEFIYTYSPNLIEKSRKCKDGYQNDCRTVPR